MSRPLSSLAKFKTEWKKSTLTPIIARQAIGLLDYLFDDEERVHLCASILTSFLAKPTMTDLYAAMSSHDTIVSYEEWDTLFSAAVAACSSKKENLGGKSSPRTGTKKVNEEDEDKSEEKSYEAPRKDIEKKKLKRSLEAKKSSKKKLKKSPEEKVTGKSSPRIIRFKKRNMETSNEQDEETSNEQKEEKSNEASRVIRPPKKAKTEEERSADAKELEKARRDQFRSKTSVKKQDQNARKSELKASATPKAKNGKAAGSPNSMSVPKPLPQGFKRKLEQAYDESTHTETELRPAQRGKVRKLTTHDDQSTSDTERSGLNHKTEGGADVEVQLVSGHVQAAEKIARLAVKANPVIRDCLQSNYLLSLLILKEQPTKKTLEKRHEHELQDTSSLLFNLLIEYLQRVPQLTQSDTRQMAAEYLQQKEIDYDTLEGIAIEASVLLVLKQWRSSKYPHHFQNKLKMLPKISAITLADPAATSALVAKYYKKLQKGNVRQSGINYWAYFPEEIPKKLHGFILAAIQVKDNVKAEVKIPIKAEIMQEASEDDEHQEIEFEDF